MFLSGKSARTAPLKVEMPIVVAIILSNRFI
jgi:hypothetical protein